MERKINKTENNQKNNTERASQAVLAYSSVSETDPLGMYTGFTSASAAVSGGKIYMKFNKDNPKVNQYELPTQDADDL